MMYSWEENVSFVKTFSSLIQPCPLTLLILLMKVDLLTSHLSAKRDPTGVAGNVPKCVENSSIAEDAYEAVFHCDIMQEGTLGVGDEGVGDPKQRHQTSINTHALISREYQAGIPPALTQEDGGSVVLE